MCITDSASCNSPPGPPGTRARAGGARAAAAEGGRPCRASCAGWRRVASFELIATGGTGFSGELGASANGVHRVAMSSIAVHVVAGPAPRGAPPQWGAPPQLGYVCVCVPGFKVVYFRLLKQVLQGRLRTLGTAWSSLGVRGRQKKGVLPNTVLQCQPKFLIRVRPAAHIGYSPNE
jgi:hypothetical protein